MTIPPAPGPEWTFNPPPSWAALGYDPRSGLPPDPTWPAPPVGWQFWVKTKVPAAAKGSIVRRVGGPRVVIAAAVVLVVIAFAVNSFAHSAHSPSLGVGSCWKLASGTEYAPVDCNDGAATDKVISVVSDPADCPGSGDYLRSEDDSDHSIQCLGPNTHSAEEHRATGGGRLSA